MVVGERVELVATDGVQQNGFRPRDMPWIEGLTHAVRPGCRDADRLDGDVVYTRSPARHGAASPVCCLWRQRAERGSGDHAVCEVLAIGR